MLYRARSSETRFLQESNGAWRSPLCQDIVVKPIDGKGCGAFWEPTGAKSGSTCKAGKGIITLLRGRGNQLTFCLLAHLETLLFASEPLLQVVGIPHLATHCSNCMLPIGGKLIACKGCEVVHYCSPKCQSSDARWHRDIECAALRSWTKLSTSIRGQSKEWFSTQWVRPLRGDSAPAPVSRPSDADEAVTDHAGPTRLVRAVGRALFATKSGVAVDCEVRTARKGCYSRPIGCDRPLTSLL